LASNPGVVEAERVLMPFSLLSELVFEVLEVSKQLMPFVKASFREPLISLL
jgi:hypothetical protein